MRNYYQQTEELDLSELRQTIREMAVSGEWQPFVEMVAQAYKTNSSIRDAIRGEANISGFFKAYLSINNFYLVEPETELSQGYCDYLLIPDRQRYPQLTHSYIIEMKYSKPNSSDADVQAKYDEAVEQLHRYSEDKLARQLAEGTTQHLIILQFKGAEMIKQEEL
jgi:hypothetical protein